MQKDTLTRCDAQLIRVSFFAYLWNFGTDFNTLVFQSFGQKVLYLCAFRDFGTWNCDCYSRSVAIALASLFKYALVTLNNSFLSNLPIALSAKKNKGASHDFYFSILTTSLNLSFIQNSFIFPYASDFRPYHSPQEISR